jgi:hypothetical protein
VRMSGADGAPHRAGPIEASEGNRTCGKYPSGGPEMVRSGFLCRLCFTLDIVRTPVDSRSHCLRCAGLPMSSWRSESARGLARPVPIAHTYPSRVSWQQRILDAAVLRQPPEACTRTWLTRCFVAPAPRGRLQDARHLLHRCCQLYHTISNTHAPASDKMYMTWQKSVGAGWGQGLATCVTACAARRTRSPVRAHHDGQHH